MKSAETTPGIDKLSNIASALQTKLELITELNEKNLAGLEEAEIETEIPESDEYIFNLKSNIQPVKRLIKFTYCKIFFRPEPHSFQQYYNERPVFHSAASVNQKSGQQ